VAELRQRGVEVSDPARWARVVRPSAATRPATSSSCTSRAEGPLLSARPARGASHATVCRRPGRFGRRPGGRGHQPSAACPADDGKSGSILRGRRAGRRALLPQGRRPTSDDWICRVAGDRRGWSAMLWRSGFFDRVPDGIDHTVVAMALEGTGVLDLAGSCSCEMSGHRLVAEGDETVRFRPSTASSWATWPSNARPLLGVGGSHRPHAHGEPSAPVRPDGHRPRAGAGTDEPCRRARCDRGGRRSGGVVSPSVRRSCTRSWSGPTANRSLVTEPLRSDAGDLPARRLEAGQPGSEQRDGRTILLDWSLPGAGPGCYDLGWYLALNAARLPEPKEHAIAAYRMRWKVGGCAPNRGGTYSWGCRWWR
jgi:hypothetical protein